MRDAGSPGAWITLVMLVCCIPNLCRGGKEALVDSVKTSPQKTYVNAYQEIHITLIYVNLAIDLHLTGGKNEHQ